MWAAVSRTSGRHGLGERLGSFRAYGPALQARGERGFGYDLFTKRGTAAPVLEDMYAKELDADSWKQVNELRKTDPKAADELVRTFSYHIDHGYGMDCYAGRSNIGELECLH